MTRRNAIKASAAWTALSYSRIFGANERIRIGALGTGGRCRYLLTLLKSLPGNELVEVCDVYAPRREIVIEGLGARGLAGVVVMYHHLD